MRTHPISTKSWLVALLLFAAAGCSGPDGGSSGGGTSEKGGQPTSTGRSGEGAAAARPSADGTSVVLEAMDAGGYTYVQLTVDGKPTWFAGPETPVVAGDTVIVPKRTLPMQNFQSDTLGRTFDVVYFVDSIRKTAVGSDADLTETVLQAHGGATPAASNAAPPTDVDLTDIPKADGGVTVAEVFALGKAAAGQDVVLRGRVVKYNANILGKNWLHVRDGSGGEGDNDITVTCGDTAAVGDMVLVRGKLAADRDLGFNYKFDLLIEDATVTIE